MINLLQSQIIVICRKSLSLQSVSEAVVQEIRKLLIVHPMLVLASKTAHLADKNSTNEVKRLVARITDLFVSFAPFLVQLKTDFAF